MKINATLTIQKDGDIFIFDKMPNNSPVNEGDTLLWQAGKGNFMETLINYYKPDTSMIAGNVVDSHGDGTYSKWTVTVIKKATFFQKLKLKIKKWF